MQKIENIAKLIDVPSDFLIPYGHYKAKIDLSYFSKVQNNPEGKLVLVTALTPTRTGEGKTTVAIGLVDGLRALKKKAILCLREPSLGPVFGLKGGATGGGKTSVIPSEDINLHFNGDMHALTAAINLISAVIDNHIFQGNELQIDPQRILWNRALDMNDRALRQVLVNNDLKYGSPRSEHFIITVASELMAILCLAKDARDFQNRINRIAVAYNQQGEMIYLEQLKISHAIMKLMKDALSPNLVQTLEGSPALIHGGPFANIAHGCNSLIANRLALRLGDIVVTEAGFGADLGAEKFFDIHVPALEKKPDGVVFVVTLKALKSHGGVAYENLDVMNEAALVAGTKNIERHLENIHKFGMNVIIALNQFPNDHQPELQLFKAWCRQHNQKVFSITGFNNGAPGCVELASGVLEMLETTQSYYRPLYDSKLSLIEKIAIVAKEIYRAQSCEFSAQAQARLAEFSQLGYAHFPICIAKTPASFSDDPSLLNAPENFVLHINDVELRSGAGFIVCLCGDILTMPGLPKVPNAVKMEAEALDWLE